MFRLPSVYGFSMIPEMWEKKFFRWMLQKFDLLEDRTLNDLSNLEGSLGRDSIATLKDVHLKVETMKRWLKLSNYPNVDLNEAVIGTVSLKVPSSSFWLSGSIEISISDVRVAASVKPPSKAENISESDRKRQSSESPSEEESSDEEFPATAQDLAKSFLDAQSKQEKDELFQSLYRDQPAASTATNPSTSTDDDSDDDEEERGTGTPLGFPGVLARWLQGVGDKVKVKVEGIQVSLSVTIPTGELVEYVLEIEDFDVEGITTSTPPPDNAKGDGRPKNRKEGKRCITLANIKGFLTSEASLFEPPSPSATSEVFGATSECSTEKALSASKKTITSVTSNLESFVNTIREDVVEKIEPIQQLQQQSDPDDEDQDEDEDEGVEININISDGSSTTTDSDNFADYEDSDEELLAFPRSPFAVKSQRSISDFDDDSEDEGGAAFLPPTHQDQPPLQQSVRQQENKSPVPRVNPDSEDIDNSGDDMDQDASRILSESTLFSHSEAGSLYLSAMSGLEHSCERSRHVFNELENISEAPVADSEVDERLGKLMGTGTTGWSFQPPPSGGQENANVEQEKKEKRIRKKIHDLNILEIFIPSLSAGETAVDNRNEGNCTSNYTPEYADENSEPTLPGAFSMYASRHRSPPISPPRQTSSPTPPRKSAPVVKIIDTKGSTSPLTGSVIYDPTPQNVPAEIEVHVGKFEAIADITTWKILNSMLEVIMGILTPVPANGKHRKDEENPENAGDAIGKDVEVLVESVELKLLERLAGTIINQGEGEQEPDTSNGDTVLEFFLQEMKIRNTSLPGNASTARVEVKKLALRDKTDDIVSFIPLPSPPLTSAKGSRKRHSMPPAASENDITLIVSQNATKKRINLSTLRVRVHFELQKLEETLSAFGGFGSVLASTSASTATITKPKSEWKSPTGSKQCSNERIRQPESQAVDIKFDAKIGGALFELVGSTGSIGLETSPIKIRSEGAPRTEILIPKIGVYGPRLPWNELEGKTTTRLTIEGTKLEVLNKPEQEDLSKLLELLTPSKDRFGSDDDILIDTLLRQREQGSLLRVEVKVVDTELINLGQMDRFKEIGDEVMKVLTVTDFVTQDERPGILSLINIDSVHCGVDTGHSIGRIDVGLGGVAVAHVSAPSLVAVGISDVGVKRDGAEELVGEGLERSFFGKTDEGRPMLMVRMVGDEPEPIIKLKLWNFRYEYRVETLMALMEAPENATGEVLAKEMVESIVMAAKRRPEPKKSRETKPPLGFDVGIRDSVIGLNPLDVKSRGLLILTDSRVQAALPVDGKLEVDVEVKKASLRVIDDIANLTAPERIHHSRRKEVLSEHLAGFANMGYVQVVSISSARVILRVVESAKPGEKTVDLEVHDDLLLLESCADSTQTLINIMNGLKPPFPEGEEVKYLTQIMEVDMFKSLTEDAFAPSWRRKAGEPATSTIHEDDEDDLVSDDVPMNLTFVESYYGHQTPNISRQTNDEIADYLLDDDLHNIAPRPSKPLGVGEKGMFTSFTEQIATLEDGPLDINEHHFDSGKRSGSEGKLKASASSATSLSEIAITNVLCFPLRIRVRDVHVIWNLHDGYDWQRTRDTITQAVKKVENKALERRNRRPSIEFDDDDEGVIEDVLFNSIYIRIPAKGDPREWTKDMARNFDDHTSETSYASSGFESRPSTMRGRSSTDPTRKNNKFRRSKSHKMQFELKGLCVDFLLFPPGGETQSSIDLRVKDLEIFDNLPTSTWKKFVTYMKDAGERETASNMVHVELLTVKPVPDLAASELVLKTTVLPLRLHVDQYALEFLIRFFEFKDDSAGPSIPSEPPFLQRVEVNSVRVKLDYKPHKVDYAGLQSGHTTELMNFFILEEADMIMRHVVLYGISGFPRMGQALNDTWMPDIKATQLGDVLAGVAPVRSLVNIGSGVKNLVVVPMREYKKDGRVVRSLQKGAVKFAKHTTSELVRLGAKLAVGTQNILENTEEFFVPTVHLPEVFEASDSEDETPKVISLYADQPTGVIQGLRTAGESLRRNFGSAKDALMAVPNEVKEKGSAQGAAQAVAKAVPIALLRPMIGTSEAVSRTLLGVTNSLDPEQKRRVDDKYKKH